MKLKGKQKKVLKKVAVGTVAVGTVAVGTVAVVAVVAITIHKRFGTISFNENGSDPKDLALTKEMKFREAIKKANENHTEEFNELLKGRKVAEQEEVIKAFEALKDEEINNITKDIRTIEKDIEAFGLNPTVEMIKLLRKHGIKKVNKTVDSAMKGKKEEI